MCMSMITTHCRVTMNIQHTLCTRSRWLRISYNHLNLLYTEMMCSLLLVAILNGHESRNQTFALLPEGDMNLQNARHAIEM